MSSYEPITNRYFLGFVDDAETCPICDADMNDGPIPFEIREHYSPPFRWSRVIVFVWNDRADECVCPDCGGKWLA